MTNRFGKILALGLLLLASIATVTACNLGGEQNNLEEQEEPGNVEDDDNQNKGQTNDPEEGEQEEGEQNDKDDRD